ncbi:prevent-host-death family protein [Mycolicibacterium fortuitum subsp. acetamidolyticum]|uniref:Prevent-host-death family protein n=2 Tax=Mycobacteriaceae TaxID=1762 RepID=A0A100WQ65_MYCFO|nr:prevent-host-death family protein [Mycolicibacterium fortuitum subsp. acetamidolyticum]
MCGMETVGARQVWRQWSDIAELFRGPHDPDWEADRDKIADEPRAERRPVPSNA